MAAGLLAAGRFTSTAVYQADFALLLLSVMHDWKEHYPDRLEPTSRPLERVDTDSYSSSITSVEGYNHAVIYTDSYEEKKV